MSSHTQSHNDEIQISRIWAMPNKNTFDIKPIRSLIMEEMGAGVWIDPFANKNKLASITNDLNSEYDTDFHMDALDFLKTFENESVDGILYDPPYSPRQVSECYHNVGYDVTNETTRASFWGNQKKRNCKNCKARRKSHNLWVEQRRNRKKTWIYLQEYFLCRMAAGIMIQYAL